MSSNCDFDRFCFMCTYFTADRYKVEITVKVMKMFKECYKHSMINVDSNYSPNIICKMCYAMMYKHLNDQKSLSLATPARWRDPRSHPQECFSCNTSTNGANHTKRRALKFAYGYSCSAPVFKKDISVDSSSAEASLPAADQPASSSSFAELSASAADPLAPSSSFAESSIENFRKSAPSEPGRILRSQSASIDVFDSYLESLPAISSDQPLNDLEYDDNEDPWSSEINEECVQKYLDSSFLSDATEDRKKNLPSSPGFKISTPRREKFNDKSPIKLNTPVFNDFCRQFIRGKRNCASVGKFFHDHGMLEDSVDWVSHLHREISLVDYFDELPDGTPYCKAVDLLITDWFELPYDANDYRLFLDSGKGSLKAVLLSNDGRLRSLPLLYSTTLKETQDDVEKVLQAINYFKHNWLIVADLKMVGVLLGECLITIGFSKLFPMTKFFDSNNVAS